MRVMRRDMLLREQRGGRLHLRDRAGRMVEGESQQKIDEMEENERRNAEEMRRIKATVVDKKVDIYGTTGSRNPMPHLRKQTAKLRKHRCLWDSESQEGHMYRCSLAEMGGGDFLQRHSKPHVFVAAERATG